ncbi:tudor domain-containing protein 6-like [Ochlerotatus camptorhynchus]|uniref:tudor domain-containing protein 6-like n=1 Tax=Ochlerotatus camptorhynchus TaxID=644619 RepID=UPI0031DB5EE7
MHNVLQTVEKELLETVRNDFVKYRTEIGTVQKQLATTERDLSRSIEQLKTFQVVLPRQTLLTDLTRDMKKMLQTAPITANFQEPKENPFQFRELMPLRRDIHNYFTLDCNRNSYRHTVVPYFVPEPAPVLEPIKSPETLHSPEATPSAMEHDGSKKPGFDWENLDKSTASSSHTVKEMDISKISDELENVEEVQFVEESLSLGSGKTTGSQTRTKKKKNKKGKDRSSHESSRSSLNKNVVDVGMNAVGKASSTATMKAKCASPDVEIIDRPEQTSNSRQGGNRHSPRRGFSSKRTFGGRLKSQGLNSSAHSSSNQHASASAPVDSSREGNTVFEINPINPDNALFIKFSQKVNVTYVTSPHKFYVQNQAFKSIVNQLCCDDAEAEDAEVPEDVKIGKLYLAQPTADRRWYRSRVIGYSKETKKYDVRFVDYGRTDEILHSRLRVLQEDMQEFEDGAYECALYDIVPADGSKTWAPEVKQIMVDFIENKQSIMYVIQTDTDGIDHVDLIMQTVDSPKSLRDALIYLNLAKPDPNPTKRSEDSSQRIDHLEKVKKRWILDYKRKIAARKLEKDDVFRTKITLSLSPSEFYICKNGWRESYQKMQTELSIYCNKDARVAYLPHVGMVCAFSEKDHDDLLVWKRGRIVKVGEGKCEVYSVDTGHRLTIGWENIREISGPFSSPPAFAVCCKLMHIEPFKQHMCRWTAEAIEYFNGIARTLSVFQVIVGGLVADCYDVVLHIVKRRYDVCVNGLMVKNGFAVSTGEESSTVERVKEVPTEDGAQANTSKASKVEKKVTRAQVEVLRVVSPSEFYVSLLKNASGIARMQDDIQNKMDDKMDDGDDKTTWQRGEMCLVFPTTATGQGRDTIGCEWYRGRVIEVVDDSNYTVFLIDKAHTMNSHYSNMSTIPPLLKEFHPVAIRCFLACVGPSGLQETWTPSVIDAFRVAIDKFKFYSISVHGRCVNDSVPVILWGMTMERVKALSPQLYIYTNINSKLVKYGYAHLKEKFPPLSEAFSVEEELERHYKAFDKLLDDLDVEMEEQKRNACDSESSDEYQVDISGESTPIDHWLPANPIEKNIFVAMPTYVDNNGVIYLHDVDKDLKLTAIKKAINAKFNGSQHVPGDKDYAIGQPCLAKFHVDDQFYRAVVRKAIGPGRYKVQFVDYGNIEDCGVEDLRKDVICGSIPMLANKYRLTDVAPARSDDIWPVKSLDTLHSLIVGKRCQVRVDNDMDTDTVEVIPCYLRTTGELAEDVSEYLVENELAIKKRGVFQEKVDILYDPFSETTGNSNDDATTPKAGRRIAANFGTGAEAEGKSKVERTEEDLQAHFSSKELTDLLDSVTAEREEGEDSGDNSSGIDMNKVQYFYSFGDVKQEPDSGSEDDDEIRDLAKKIDQVDDADVVDASSNISFNPNEFDTSTQIDPPLEITRPTLHGYPKLAVDESIKGFYCEVTYMINSTEMFVYPQLDEHIQLMKSTMAQIQTYAKKHRKCPDIETNMPCLALFPEDGFWYRALIDEYFPERAEARVYYVDYLNKETVNVRDILKCPVSLRKVPLRVMKVKLHKLRANTRMRDGDVTNKLVELVESKRLYARIMAHNSVVEVELFTDSRCNQLVYRQLIKDKYYSAEK